MVYYALIGGRMEKLSQKEIQAHILEVLIYLDEVCRKNNIKYMLCSGTCLGAVRHKGFIPWDNDADVFMDRENYNKFFDVMQKENSKFKLLDYKNTENYCHPFFKLVDSSTYVNEIDLRYKSKQMGVWVDIFPIDGLPNNKKEQKKYLRKRYIKLKLLCAEIIISPNPIKRAIKNFIRLFLSKPYYKRIEDLDNFCLQNSSPDGKYMLDATWGTKSFPRECWDNLTEAEFEGHMFFIPKNYNLYLSTIYGDYMKLPKEKDRVSHTIQAYKLTEEDKNE